MQQRPGYKVGWGAAVWLACAACGQVSHNAPTASGGAAGTSAAGAPDVGGSMESGGAPPTTTGGMPNGGLVLNDAGSAGVGPLTSGAVCDNTFQKVDALPFASPLVFFGTYDGAPVNLRSRSDDGLPPKFFLLRFGRHFEAVSLDFVTVPWSGDITVQVNVVTCEVQGQLLDTGSMPVKVLRLENGQLVTKTVTEDWSTGITTGSLHAEFVSDDGSERHVLQAKLSLDAVVGEAQRE